MDQAAVTFQAVAFEAFKLLDKKVKAAANATLGLSEGDKILGVSEERGIFGPSFVFVGIHRQAQVLVAFLLVGFGHSGLLTKPATYRIW